MQTIIITSEEYLAEKEQLIKDCMVEKLYLPKDPIHEVMYRIFENNGIKIEQVESYTHQTDKVTGLWDKGNIEVSILN